MIGSNVPAKGGLPTGFYFGDKWGCECIQVYLTLSRRWDVPALLPEDVRKFKIAWQKSSIRQVIAHVPFLVNPASDSKLLWEKSVNRLNTEICRAIQLGVPFLVMHPGSCGRASREEGLNRIAEALNKISPQNGHTPTVLIETMAGQGAVLGSSFEEISQIIERSENSEYIGICFDTAHVFAAGYDIRGHKGYERTLDLFDKIIGIDKIRAIHLNDTKTSLGSKNDRHACIGEGNIGLDTFHTLLRDRRFLDIPKILEIPERDIRSKDNIILLKKLQACVTLPPENGLPGHLPMR